MSDTVAIIVAMKSEIDPLLQLWRRQGKSVESVANTFRCGAIQIYYGGIGPAMAARAAASAVARDRPKLLVSAGLAGAATPSAKVGELLRPASVIDASTGKVFRVRDTHAAGVLVTAKVVVSTDKKEELARQFQASAVDMEAAAVAAVAEQSGVHFMALKAISDPLNFPMPPLDRFISPEGKLDLLHLLGWAALRPGAWRALALLRRNSRKAAEELARGLEQVLAERDNED